MITHCDVIVDLQAGDTGKGKVAHHLASKNSYDLVMRYNGGANAGHTIFVNGTKIVTHQVPVGIFHNIPSLIGLGCVVNLEKLQQECEMLHSLGFRAPVFIDIRAHVTLPHHMEEDSRDMIIGTTRMGIGPTYRDKYDRKGVRAGMFDNTEWYTMVDTAKLLGISPLDVGKTRNTYDTVLCEGAQGYQIDVDWGDYPYVTSSHCTIGSVALNGIAPRYLRNVYGIMKAYETYSGFKKTFIDVDNPVFKKIQEVGHEFGATTGRERQVRWLKLDDVIQAMYINNITDLVINKVDVLDVLGQYGVVWNNNTLLFDNRTEFVEFVEETIRWYYRHPLNSLTWSTSPETV